MSLATLPGILKQQQAGLDLLSSEVVAKSQAIYGTKLLVSGYAGSAIQLWSEYRDTQALGDNPKDFSFGSDGELDRTAIEDWHTDSGAGNLDQNNDLRVDTLYDQSGNGEHLSAAGTQRPLFMWEDDAYKIRSEKDGNPVIAFGETRDNPSGTAEFLNRSVANWNGTGVDNHNAQCMVLCRGQQREWSFRNYYASPTYSVGDAAQATNKFGFSTSFFNITNTVANPRYQRGYCFNGGNTLTNSSLTFPNTRPAVFSMQCQPGVGETLLKVGDWGTWTINTSLQATGQKGFRWSQAWSNWEGGGRGMALILSTVLTSDEEDGVRAVLESRFNEVTNNKTNQLFVDGDSLSAGHRTTTFDFQQTSWAYSVGDSLGSDWLVRNTAHGGGNLIPADAKNIEEGAEDAVDANFDDNAAFSFTENILAVWIGTNDLIALTGVDGDAETIEARIKAYCQDRLTKGWKVVLSNLIPREAFTAGQETERLALNALLAANWNAVADEYATAFVDMDSQVNWTDSSYATYYQDGVHPSEAGQAVAAAAMLTAVQSILD